MVPKNLNFLEVCAISAVPQDESKLKSDASKQVLRVFGANTRRAANIAALPGFSHLLGSEFNLALSDAGRHLLVNDFTPENFAQKQEEIKRLAHEFLNQRMHSLGFGDAWKKEFVEHTKLFESHSQHCGDSHLDSVENLLRTIVVDAWGCFELLAQQLYDKIGAEFPHKYPVMKGRFRSRDKIRMSYEKRFANAEVSRILASSSLDALALLRNVIVHNAGIVDEEFIKAQDQGSPWLHRFKTLCKDKDPITLDGGLVKNLVNSVWKSGYELIRTVDELSTT